MYAADKDKRRFLASYIIRFWPPRKLFAAFFAGVGAAGALLAFALFKPTHFREPGSLNTALALGAMFVLSLVYALRVDDYWIIDSKTSTIWLRRAGIWQLSLRAKAKFSECDGVRLVRLRFDEGPDQWAVSVVLADKTDFTVKQSEDREEMSAVAKQLSGLIGVQLSIS